MADGHDDASLRVRRSLTFQPTLRSADNSIPVENRDIEATLPGEQFPIRASRRYSLLTRVGNFYGSLFRKPTQTELKKDGYEKDFLQWRKSFLSEDCKLYVNHATSNLSRARAELWTMIDKAFPEGWPQMAAFLDSCGTFSIYRRFGNCHSRILLNYMVDITSIEKKLLELDQNDLKSVAVDGTSYRLRTRLHKEGSDTTKNELLAELESKLHAYDDLLLKQHKLKSLHQTSETDHHKVSKWIWMEKPVRRDQYKFIFHHQDFVSLIPPAHNRFENSVKNFLISRFKNYNIIGSKTTTADPKVAFYSAERITFIARLCMVVFAVLILYVPVVLLLLVSMNQICLVIVVLVFVFVFSTAVSLLPEASVMDIFVGSATYFAVLVTLLGNLQGAAGCTKLVTNLSSLSSV